MQGTHDVIEQKVNDLLGQMTLRERFQLLSSNARLRFYSTKPNKRLGIPSFKVTDGPLGVAWHSSRKKATRFPATIGIAATWNRVLAFKTGAAMGQEVRGSGRHMLLAPGINIARTPLNGRTFEYFSEDPYLTREMAAPMVKGIQSEGVGACLKHFAVNNQETDRRSSSSEVDERTLHEIYLRAFEGVVREAQPWGIMSAYNKVNGVYCSENKYLLQDVLVDRWEFEGFVISDWFATRPIKSSAACIEAGLSLEMPWPKVYGTRRLKKSFEEGQFSVEKLDELLRRYLTVLHKTEAFRPAPKTPKVVSTLDNQALSREVAQESIVLLKNEESVLPLNESDLVCVFGPNLKKKFGRILYGGSSAVVPPHEVTQLEGMLKHKNVSPSRDRHECVTSAQACVVFAGLDHGRGKDSETKDRESLDLPDKQVRLIKEIVRLGRPTVVVLLAGSPIAMSDWIEDVQAVVMAWYPGMEGGHAVADVLFGQVNPSGKLPITFPARLEDSPAHASGSPRTYPGDDENRVWYDEGIYVGYRWFDEKEIEPLFPFGYGMSYTQFRIGCIQLEKEIFNSYDDITNAEIEIENTGDFAGAEVVQLYLDNENSRVSRPRRELIGFDKVHLEPGESGKARIKVKAKDLAHYDVESHRWKIEERPFDLVVGNYSRCEGERSKIIYRETR
jgi:beta-glucosidase